MTTHTSVADDAIYGVEALSKYLGEPWTVRRVRYARETGALPIRVKPGIGLYAFKTELYAAMHGSDSLPPVNKR